MKLKNYPLEKRRFYHSLIFPFFFLCLLWIVKLYEIVDNVDLWYYGIYPRKISSIKGILFSPVIHGSLNHLVDNSIPLFFLSLALFYFYNKVAYKVFFITYFSHGVLVWIYARSAYHIGASGLIYGFGAFLFFSGIMRKNINLLAISLLVIFMYGSMVWGIFPYKDDVSWESHLAGGLAGFLLSIYFRKQGPVPTTYEWEEEEETETDDDKMDSNNQIR